MQSTVEQRRSHSDIRHAASKHPHARSRSPAGQGYPSRLHWLRLPRRWLHRSAAGLRPTIGVDRRADAVHHCRRDTRGRRPMARAQARPKSTDPRVIEIDTRRVLSREQKHFAVVDIGSNSIRLVVYDDLSRAPFPRFNEKSFCALGAGLDDAGRLDPAAIEMAVRAVGRFEAIARAMQVETVHVIATEATRRASNGGDLVDAIRATTGLETRVLSGQEEATYAALGRDLRLLPAEGAGRRHGRRQPRGRRGARRPGGRAHGQHAARRAAGEGDAGRGSRRGEEEDRRGARRRAAAVADRSGVLRDRRRLARAGAGAHRAGRRARSASSTATTSRPRTCGRWRRRSRGWRRRRSPRCRTSRAGASTRCRRPPR